MTASDGIGQPRLRKMLINKLLARYAPTDLPEESNLDIMVRLLVEEEVNKLFLRRKELTAEGAAASGRPATAQDSARRRQQSSSPQQKIRVEDLAALEDTVRDKISVLTGGSAEHKAGTPRSGGSHRPSASLNLDLDQLPSRRVLPSKPPGRRTPTSGSKPGTPKSQPRRKEAAAAAGKNGTGFEGKTGLEAKKGITAINNDMAAAEITVSTTVTELGLPPVSPSSAGGPLASPLSPRSPPSMEEKAAAAVAESAALFPKASPAASSSTAAAAATTPSAASPDPTVAGDVAELVNELGLDEWTMMGLYDSLKHETEQSLRRQQVEDRKALMREELDRQVKAKLRVRAASRAKRTDHIGLIEADMELWKQEELAKKAKRWDAEVDTKRQLDAQLAYQRRLRDEENRIRSLDEGEQVRAVRAELKRAEEAREEARLQRVAAAAEVRAQNEENARAAARRQQRERDEDVELMRRYKASEDAKEAAREAHNEELRRKQKEFFEQTIEHQVEAGPTREQLAEERANRQAAEREAIQQREKRQEEEAARRRRMELQRARLAQMREKREAAEAEKAAEKVFVASYTADAEAALADDRAKATKRKEENMLHQQALLQQIDEHYASVGSGGLGGGIGGGGGGGGSRGGGASRLGAIRHTPGSIKHTATWDGGFGGGGAGGASPSRGSFGGSRGSGGGSFAGDWVSLLTPGRGDTPGGMGGFGGGGGGGRTPTPGRSSRRGGGGGGLGSSRGSGGHMGGGGGGAVSQMTANEFGMNRSKLAASMNDSRVLTALRNMAEERANSAGAAGGGFSGTPRGSMSTSSAHRTRSRGLAAFGRE
eukprot:g1755.t1